MIAPPIKVVPAHKLPGNARHTLLGIKISEAAPMKTSILAHEVAEWQFLRKIQAVWVAIGLGLGIVIALFTAWPAALAGALLGFLIGSMEAREKGTFRRMEFFGHAAEVAAAVRFYGADETQVRHEEARALATAPSYSTFMRGWTLGRIEDELVMQGPAARAWVARNAAALDAWKERNG